MPEKKKRQHNAVTLSHKSGMCSLQTAVKFHPVLVFFRSVALLTP